jgi:hypothetical protein
MGQLVLIARNQPHSSIFDESDCPVTVPLDFEQPLGAIKWLFDRGGQHGMNFGGHGALDGGQAETVRKANLAGTAGHRIFES